MANQNSIQDDNQVFAIIGHSGTAGTSETRRLLVDDNGALRVGGTVTTDLAETTGFNGGTVSVGTSAVELTFTGVTQAIMITADHSNTGDIYIGGSTVTSVGANSITRMVAGESLSIELNDGAAPLYAVGSTTGQKVYKVALT